MLRDDLEDAFIGIWGLGLMGGSLAMALKPHCKNIVGIDCQPEVVERALAGGVVTQASSRPEDIISDVDGVILAVPVGAILEIIQQLPALCASQLVVLDLGSTKAEVVAAYRTLPEHIYPVAGHPMCGKSVLGLENADPLIFQDAPFMLYPLARSEGQAFNLAWQIVKAVGAVPLRVDPEVHDRWVAASSHLPYLAASALALSVPDEAAPLVGSGFASTSRLAETPTSMMLDVIKTNQINILEVLRGFQAQIAGIADVLESGEMGNLEDLLDMAAEKRGALMAAGDSAK